MLKKILLPLFILLIVSTYSCRKNKLFTGSANLKFSVDTVIFDTVFTQIGSITKVFKVYNPYKQPVVISSIALAGGSGSNFRINIDGQSKFYQENIELRAQDSIFIFAEVTVDPNNGSNPMVITDSIVFSTNGNIQDVDLVAWGQDAYFWYSTNGSYFFPIDDDDVYYTNYVLPTDKPHVVYGYLVIDSTNTLTLPEGLKMYFHQYSGLGVDASATLKVEGTKDNPVLFTSDRLDMDYRDIPGQWGHPALGGIWLSQTSTDNEINYAIIRNGNIGLEADSFNTSSSNPTLRLTNTIIENMSGVGLFAKNATVEASNCIFSNCGQFTTALAYGGDYEFSHCTFGNYWPYASRDKGQLLLNNYLEADGIQKKWNLNASFNNCIVYGNKEDEIVLDNSSSGSFSFDYFFNNCLLKTTLATSGTNYFNIIKNPAEVTVDGQSHDPVFKDPNNNDFHLFDQSAALNNGLIITGLETDLEGNNRDANPDLGAIEFMP